MKNWNEYNKKLIKRGTILFNPNLIPDFSSKIIKKKGRPYKYSHKMIFFMIIVKFTFHIPYRQLEGFFRSFFSQLGIKEVPNFRTIFYRFTKIPEELKEMLIKIDVKELPEDFVIAIDSTGIKLSNRGEWLSKKQKEKSRKGWVKLHVAMDIHSHQVVDIKITDESVGDSEVGLELVSDCNRALQEQGKRIQKVLGDKGYDTYEIFERLKQMGIEPAIMVRDNAQVNVKGYNYSYRNQVVKELKKDKEEWKRKRK